MPSGSRAVTLCVLVSLLSGATRAAAQIIVKAGDDVNFKLGLLGQFQADTIEDPGTDAQTSNLFIRRLRLMFRDPPSHRAFRYAGRVQYNMVDPEIGFFYTGTYLGKKKIAAVGGAFDIQDDYHAYAADVFIDHPLGPGAVTGQLGYNRFDGGTTLRTLPRQRDALLEVGYLVRALKVTPFVQLTNRNLVDTATGDETRISLGGSYWWGGHNANIKAAYTHINPTVLASQNEFTIQLQVFYF